MGRVRAAISMWVLFISANTERMNLLPMPLGAALVTKACQRAGHTPVLLDLMFAADAAGAMRECVEGFQPQVLGISVRNIDDQNMSDKKFLLPPVWEVIRTCRSLCSAPIVVGGAGNM